MPVLRNEYTIEQFEEALQKLAHKLPKFKKVATEGITITFHYTDDGDPRRITIQHHKKTGRKDQWGYPETEWWGFSIESKLYTDSNHATKINYSGYKTDKRKIEQWLKELMGNTKPKPRFSLKLVPS